jgi:hypothetical protein
MNGIRIGRARFVAEAIGFSVTVIGFSTLDTNYFFNSLQGLSAIYQPFKAIHSVVTHVTLYYQLARRARPKRLTNWPVTCVTVSPARAVIGQAGYACDHSDRFSPSNQLECLVWVGSPDHDGRGFDSEPEGATVNIGVVGEEDGLLEGMGDTDFDEGANPD